MKRHLLAFLLMIVYTEDVIAQYSSYNMSNQTVTISSPVHFYDSGGPSGNYADNENYTMTFTSSGGGCISVAFFSYYTESASDYLYVYNGTNTGSPQLGTLNNDLTGSSMPGTCFFSASSGSITFNFQSNASFNYRGWSAIIYPGVCPSAGASNPDCNLKTCFSTVVSANASGSGSVSDFNSSNNGCYDYASFGERNTSWYKIVVGTSGTMELAVYPSNTSQDFDFVLWGPNPNCDPTSGPVKCSYSSSGGYTGISTNNDGDATPNSEGSTGDNWVQDLNVTANQIYILVISDYVPSGGSFTAALGGTATYLNTCSPLPIELTKFDAACDNGNIKINWTTASETNNDFYTVEKSTNGSDIETVTTIKGARTSHSLNTYTTYDTHPGIGQNYYRLKQTDFDGTSETYNWVAAHCDESETPVSVHPNPVKDNVQFDFSVKNNEKASFLIYNASGKIVYTNEQMLSKGFNEIKMNTATLPKGLYLARFVFSLSGKNSTVKFLKT